uniref:Large envelope protein n=1 Tax=Zeugodacus cucurbitae TaxID=28588 RepID=A0A0A1XGM7_ZEUCU
MNDHLRRRHPSSHSVEKTSSAIVERAPAVSDLDIPSCSSTQRDVNLTVETIESEISSASLVPPVNVETTSSSTIPSRNVSDGGPLKRRAMQTKLFVTSTRSELSETEKRSIDEYLIKMVTRDMQPLSIVKNEGLCIQSQTENFFPTQCCLQNITIHGKSFMPFCKIFHTFL